MPKKLKEDITKLKTKEAFAGWIEMILNDLCDITSENYDYIHSNFGIGSPSDFLSYVYDDYLNEKK